jgi:hypothetical protein
MHPKLTEHGKSPTPVEITDNSNMQFSLSAELVEGGLFEEYFEI